MSETEDKPPGKETDSQRVCSTGRYHRISLRDLHWIPIWRGGNLASLDTCLPIGYHRLQFHTPVDLGA